MRILVIGAFLLAGWMGIGAYWHTCHIRMLCDDCKDCEKNVVADNPETEDLETEKLPTKLMEKASAWAVLGQDDQEVMRFSEPALITKGLGDVELPEAAQPVLDSIYSYLLKHPDHYVEVTGSHDPDQEQADGETDLGMLRAESFRTMLEERGENPDRIEPKSRSVSIPFNEEGKYNGGLDLVFGKLEGEMEKEVDAHIADKTLYCDFGRTKFKPDPTLVNYTAELMNYLDKNPGMMVYITGHTDHKGSAKVNESVGLQRASQVRRYFVSQGMDRSMIKIDSEGENDPVASNDSDEGRALNRRIHVSVK